MTSRQAQGFDLLIRAHHPAFSPGIDRRIVEEIARCTALERSGERTGLWDFYQQVISAAVSSFRRSGGNPRRFVGSRILVVKTATARERGVIMVDYTYVFPLLAGLFDIRAIADRYFIVLEPSWSDCCTPEILQFTQLDSPVLIQSVEPRDEVLFGALRSNCTRVPTAPNWWVDYRTMSPRPTQNRDIDIIMIAAWAGFKRHWRFFRALADLKARGHRLKVALVGYRNDKSAADILAEARHFGVSEFVELFERLSADEVADLLSRSRLHVLWSRREGANRAIIESMLAGVPVLVRAGLTYGARYPYINPQTGRFVAEGDLPDAILEMLSQASSFKPREWVLENMTCQHAVAIVDEHLQEQAHALGEDWTHGIVARTSALDTQRYWNPEDRALFDGDHRFLDSAIRELKAGS